MNNKIDIMEFIINNMPYIGFGNYLVEIKEVKKLNSLATIEVSELSQKIILTIPFSFYKIHDVEQINILLHELIHGRISLKNQRVNTYIETIEEQEEEKCVNDITTLSQRWYNDKNK